MSPRFSRALCKIRVFFVIYYEKICYSLLLRIHTVMFTLSICVPHSWQSNEFTVSLYLYIENLAFSIYILVLTQHSVVSMGYHTCAIVFQNMYIAQNDHRHILTALMMALFTVEITELFRRIEL